MVGRKDVVVFIDMHASVSGVNPHAQIEGASCRVINQIFCNLYCWYRLTDCSACSVSGGKFILYS